MTFSRQTLRIILWLLTPEPSDINHDSGFSPSVEQPPATTPLPGWIKALFWYSVALALFLFPGIWE